MYHFLHHGNSGAAVLDESLVPIRQVQLAWIATKPRRLIFVGKVNHGVPRCVLTLSTYIGLDLGS